MNLFRYFKIIRTQKCTQFASSTDKLNQIGDHFGIEVRYSSFDEMLQDKDIDAVHINTPIPDHAEQSVKALLAEESTWHAPLPWQLLPGIADEL